METIQVVAEIEQSGTGVGQIVRVRSDESVWCKQYNSRLEACIEAAQLGLVDRLVYPSEERYLLNVRYSAKADAKIDPDELTRSGFELLPRDGENPNIEDTGSAYNRLPK